MDKNTNTTLHLPTVEGETEQEKRRRAALAITNVLSEDDLLRAEVCALLSIDDDDVLKWRTPPKTTELFTAV
tara:strand:- start:3191 stop:3406 length:216 start_codon:yes stop_codon:yes gene_type:complete